MILDRYNEYSDGQAETTVAAHDSTNTVDLLKDGAGESKQMRLHVMVDTSCTSGGAATVAVEFQHSSNGSSWETLWVTPAPVAVASLVAGYHITPRAGVPVPASVRRYTKVVYTIGTAALTAGKFNALLSNGADTNNFN